LVALPASTATTGVHTTFIAVVPTGVNQAVSVNPDGWTSAVGLTLGPTPALADLDMSVYGESFPIASFTLTDDGSTLSSYNVLSTNTPNSLTGAITVYGNITSATGTFAGLLGASVTIVFTVSPLNLVNTELTGFGLPNPAVMLGTITVP